MHRFFWTLLLLPVLCAQAQSQPRTFGIAEDRQTNVPSYFYHVLPGEATIQVYVWGTVGAPGAYTVSTRTTMDEVLTLAGGPRLDVVEDSYDVTTTIRLYRIQGDRRTSIYEATLETMIREPQNYPTLEGGDVIEVSTFRRRNLNFRDYLGIVGSIAALGIAVERLVSAIQ